MIHARDDYNHIQDPSSKIPDDEPVFLLRGQDSCAPTIVRMWANLVEARGGGMKIVARAREHARRMEEWQAKHGNKTPDMPGDAPNPYVVS